VFAAILTVVAIVAGPATAGGKSHGPRNARYGTLVATPNELRAGDFFDVSGCGYESEYGNVLLGFGGGGWGSPLNEASCFTISNIPVGGDNPTPGTYPVTAYQWVKNKWTATGETTVTILAS